MPNKFTPTAKCSMVRWCSRCLGKYSHINQKPSG